MWGAMKVVEMQNKDIETRAYMKTTCRAWIYSRVIKPNITSLDDSQQLQLCTPIFERVISTGM